MTTPTPTAAPSTVQLLRLIEGLSAGWDEHGSTGPREPYSWETVARMAMDYARAALSTPTVPAAEAPKPLSLEFIDQHIGSDEGDREAVITLVREVEKAHGILPLATLTECHDNDSPWLVCKPCAATGECRNATPPTEPSSDTPRPVQPAEGETPRDLQGVLPHAVGVMRTLLAHSLTVTGNGETGWLVEHSGKMGHTVQVSISWLCIEPKFEGYGAQEFGYTTDASKALRLARKEDAEAVLRMYLGANPPKWFSEPFSVTQHEWPLPLAASPPPEAQAPSEPTPLDDMRARKDAAYLERNRVVAALASAYPSGIARTAIEGWSEDWHGCVYIDLPTGQASWHYHDSHAHLFEHLPAYQKAWDGHTTEEKYERLAALAALPTPPVSEHDKRDAERYRWLRSQKSPEDFYSGAPRWSVAREQGGYGEVFREENLDAAIDAALKGEAP